MDPEDLPFQMEPGAELVELAPGLSMPLEVHLMSERWPGFSRIELLLRLTDGRYRCFEMHLFREDEEITGEVLRSVPVARLIQLGINTWAKFEMPKITDEQIHAGPTRENMEHVARIYRLAHAVGQPPTQRIAETFRLKSSNAARWVTRARELHLLDPAPAAGKAGG